ncbi:MAG: RHS repeat-associated core domain-containing protein [Caldilineaceae bacterium]|nr:RHS repeat-associated core domain-containing protein [Caldilineaceae bacterium]
MRRPGYDINNTDQAYYAFGRQRDSGPVNTDHRYTGQKEDATGLYYYNARYYDPTIGHFISPDTIVPDAEDLFSYNRYMYARGNPLKYNDPSVTFRAKMQHEVSAKVQHGFSAKVQQLGMAELL